MPFPQKNMPLFRVRSATATAPRTRSFGVTGRALTAVLVATVLGGCASTPVPVEDMAVAEAAVQRASTATTRESAAPELKVAVDKLASARSALAAGDRSAARQWAQQATLDAQVAELRAQSVRSMKAATESEAAAAVLREEINRKSAPATRQ